MKSFFLDVILPLPLKDTFTYAITPAESEVIQVGMRIIVPFGKRKRYTAIAINVHQNPPKSYEPKQIDGIIDEQPVISAPQLVFLQWIATYYQAPLGLVIRTALPSVMLLESETEIVTHTWDENPETLSKNASQLLQQLHHNSVMSLSHIQQLVPVIFLNSMDTIMK